MGPPGGRPPDLKERGQHTKEEGTGLIIDAEFSCKEMRTNKRF